MKKLNNNSKGFTLIELIVVVAVVAVLSVGAVAAYAGVQSNARRAALQADANALAGALNNYNAISLTRIGGTSNGAVGYGNLISWIASPSTYTSYSINLVVPARGTRPQTEFPVVFESAIHFQRAANTLDLANGHFRVNSDKVKNPNPAF